MAIQGYNTVQPRLGAVKGKILKHSEPREVMSITGNQHKLDKNSSDTVIFRRWLPKGGATTSATTINRWSVTAEEHLTTEGVTPDADTLSAQDITVTLNQYSCLYMYTDKTAVLYEDGIPDAQKKQAGQRMGLVREMIRYGVLKGGTNKFYAGGTSRATVDESITLGKLRAITRSLEANRADKITQVIKTGPNYGSMPVNAGFIVFCHTDMASNIRDLEGFKDVIEYAAGKQVHPRELGSCEEFRFVVSPELSSYADAGAAVGSTGLKTTTGSNIDVYPVIVVADEAWGDVALKGMESFAVTHIPHSQKDKSDPHGQRGYIGAIFWSAAFIENDGWMAVLEAGVANL